MQRERDPKTFSHTKAWHKLVHWPSAQKKGSPLRRVAITKLIQDTRIKIVFCTQNTKQSILKSHAQTDKYNRNSIHQMKSVDCSLKYIGQTRWTLTIRYKGHIHTTRNNNNSGYAIHILSTGTYIWNHERYYGYNKNRNERQIFIYLKNITFIELVKIIYNMNGIYFDKYNPIFETL